jgi:hypothetical protein
VVFSDWCSSAISCRICDAQGGVEVRQRFVEQEPLGVAHDGAADGDALALAAGQLAGLAVEVVRQVQHLGRAFDLLPDSAFGHPRHLQRKAMFFRTVMCG